MMLVLEEICGDSTSNIWDYRRALVMGSKGRFCVANTAVTCQVTLIR